MSCSEPIFALSPVFCSLSQVEVYLDLACSDCALAWPVLTDVVKVYGHQAEFLYRLFPLPYHRNAFTAAKVRRTTPIFDMTECARSRRVIWTEERRKYMNCERDDGLSAAQVVSCLISDLLAVLMGSNLSDAWQDMSFFTPMPLQG